MIELLIFHLIFQDISAENNELAAKLYTQFKVVLERRNSATILEID